MRDRRLADLLVAFEILEAVAVGLQPLGAPEPFEPARRRSPRRAGRRSTARDRRRRRGRPRR